MKNKLVLLALVIFISGCKKKEVLKSGNEAKCHCEGTGDFTIVMEAGMGNWSLLYQPVFQKLLSTTRICILDRAGYEVNLSTENARDAITVALEMNKALIKKGVIDSMIVLGHSMGGLNVQVFQSLYPEKVYGMILLESAHPDQFNRLPSEFSELKNKQVGNLEKVMKKAQKGWLEERNNSIPTFGLPDDLLEDYYKITEQPEYYHTFKQEAIYFDLSLQQTNDLLGIGDLPLLVVSSKNSLDIDLLSKKQKKYPFEEHNKIWLELQQELANLSDNSTFVTSDHNHYLHVSDADFVATQIKLFFNTNF